jgi:hypothetical protein
MRDYTIRFFEPLKFKGFHSRYERNLLRMFMGKTIQFMSFFFLSEKDELLEEIIKQVYT